MKTGVAGTTVVSFPPPRWPFADDIAVGVVQFHADDPRAGYLRQVDGRGVGPLGVPDVDDVAALRMARRLDEP